MRRMVLNTVASHVSPVIPVNVAAVRKLKKSRKNSYLEDTSTECLMKRGGKSKPAYVIAPFTGGSALCCFKCLTLIREWNS